ncbi:MAG: SGNH/GDSL hydrolase family protein [Armatimonadia bacterium]
MMKRVIWSLAAILISGAIAMAQATPPEYKQQPAKLFTPRNGLGNVLAKLDAGKDVRIAYFGGSITAAAGWRPKTLKWFQETWPNAKVSEIHAAIGGTGSDLGVFRCRQDVLSKNPDLVFVEFAVNDSGAMPEAIWRSMEGIVRQIWSQDPTIDICYVYTITASIAPDLENGMCPRAAGADEMLADYYGIPSINVGLRIAQLKLEDKLIYTSPKDENGKPLPGPEGHIVFSDDSVHPLDAGHQIYTEVIANAITDLRAGAKPGPHELKPAFTPGNMEQARLVPLTPAILTPGWTKLNPAEGLAARFRSVMPELWQASTPGEKISFKFKGTTARLYDLVGPNGGQVIVTVDGKTSGPRPRFDSYCTYHRPAAVSLCEGLPDAVHEVTVELDSKQPDRSSVTNREKDKPNFNPATYDGTNLWVASLMLIGDLVE